MDGDQTDVDSVRTYEDAHTIEHIKRCHLLGQAAGGFVQMHKKS